MNFRKPYDGKRYRVSLSFEGQVSMTEQSHKDACDINSVLRRYDQTGLLTHVNQAKALYGDFTETNEYQDSLNLVIRAQNSFAELPSSLRKRFGNDPGAFFEFVTNPDNVDEMVKLGLAVRHEAAEPLASSGAE